MYDYIRATFQKYVAATYCLQHTYKNAPHG